jgi:spore germination protein KC
MRKFICLTFICLLLAAITGCSQIARSRIEIDEAMFVRVLSIDKGENNNIKVTLTSKDMSSSSSGSGQTAKQQSYNISSEGKTMLEATRALWAFADRRPYYGHTEFILISEDIAKEGILKYLDYVSRDHQFRHNSRIYIVKGSSASSLVEDTHTSGVFIGDVLKNLENNIVGLSISSTVTLAEAMFIFDNPNVSTFIPCIEKDIKIVKETQAQDKYYISIKGYAVFKEDKLVRYLVNKEARGINWVKNRITSGVILVKGRKGEYISLEIINSQTKIKPQITKDNLSCTIRVDVNTNIDEVTAADDIFDRAGIDYLNKQQEEVIRKEIENVLNIAQKANLDFFGIIQNFHMKYPVSWKEIEKNWAELFPRIKFNVVVNSKINRTYLIRDPTGSTKK